MSAARVDMRWQSNTCPLCERTFKVTPGDDILIPACGCYAEAEPGCYPCESCGLRHVYACLDKGEPPARRFTAIVGETGIIAQVEGEAEGAALTAEWFVEPAAASSEGTPGGAA